MASPCAFLAMSIYAEFSGFGPATLEFESVRVENRLVPYGDVRRWTNQLTIAIRADGSRALHFRHASYHHGFIEIERSSTTMLLDAPGRLVGVFSHDSRQVRWRQVKCDLPPVYAPASRDCPPPQPMAWGVQRSRPVNHLGFSAIAYTWWNGSEFWQSPALGCGIINNEHLRKNTWGIPGQYDRHQLRSVRFGEPDAKLFQIPAGYRTVP